MVCTYILKFKRYSNILKNIRMFFQMIYYEKNILFIF